MIPLFSRLSGSILQLGPVEQFVEEMPADQMEIRISDGADDQRAARFFSLPRTRRRCEKSAPSGGKYLQSPTDAYRLDGLPHLGAGCLTTCRLPRTPIIVV